MGKSPFSGKPVGERIPFHLPPPPLPLLQERHEDPQGYTRGLSWDAQAWARRHGIARGFVNRQERPELPADSSLAVVGCIICEIVTRHMLTNEMLTQHYLEYGSARAFGGFYGHPLATAEDAIEEELIWKFMGVAPCPHIQTFLLTRYYLDNRHRLHDQHFDEIVRSVSEDAVLLAAAWQVEKGFMK